MKIVVTNDDGIDAPGIAVLAKLASELGRVTVVAPMRGVSSCSHHVTTHRDIEIRQAREDWFAVDGYPADCIRIALTLLAPDADLVLSGVNDGGNLGGDLLMSGTASAAREAALRGIRAIAVSQYKARRSEVDWPIAGDWTRRVLKEVLQRPALESAFWNINLPDPSIAGAVPEIKECDHDLAPLPVGFEYQSGVWRYVSQYQSRPRTPGKDVALCFGGAITLSAIPCFQ